MVIYRRSLNTGKHNTIPPDRTARSLRAAPESFEGSCCVRHWPFLVGSWGFLGCQDIRPLPVSKIITTDWLKINVGFAFRVSTRTMTPAITIISLENSNQFSDNVKKKEKKGRNKIYRWFKCLSRKTKNNQLKN